MKSFIEDNWFYLLSSVSILTNIFFAIYFGIKNWSKTRTIYQIERKIIRQVRGETRRCCDRTKYESNQ